MSVRITPFFISAEPQLDCYGDHSFDLFEMKPDTVQFLLHNHLLPLRVEHRLKRNKSQYQLFMSLEDFQFWNYDQMVYRQYGERSIQLELETTDLITRWIHSMTDLGLIILKAIKTIEAVDIHVIISDEHQSFPAWIQVRSMAPTRIVCGHSTTLNPKSDPPYWKHEFKMNQSFEQIVHPYLEHTVFFDKAEYIQYVYETNHSSWITEDELVEKITQ